MLWLFRTRVVFVDFNTLLGDTLERAGHFGRWQGDVDSLAMIFECTDSLLDTLVADGGFGREVFSQTS